MVRAADAEARAEAAMENARIGELKNKTLGRALHLPEEEFASVLTVQELTDEQLDSARGVTIEVWPGNSRSTEQPRVVTRTPTGKAGSLKKPPANKQTTSPEDEVPRNS